MFKFYTQTGKIGYDKAVFARIAVEAARKTDRSIIFANSKGKPVKTGITGNEKLNFIDVSEGEEKNTVNLTIYLILRFGTSISRTTAEISKNIRTEIKTVTGVKVDRLRIVIKGMKSEKTAKRNVGIDG